MPYSATKWLEIINVEVFTLFLPSLWDYLYNWKWNETFTEKAWNMKKKMSRKIRIFLQKYFYPNFDILLGIAKNKCYCWHHLRADRLPALYIREGRENKACHTTYSWNIKWKNVFSCLSDVLQYFCHFSQACITFPFNDIVPLWVEVWHPDERRKEWRNC